MSQQIHWWEPQLGNQEKINLSKVIDSQFPNHGVFTVEFEKQIAELCGVSYAVAVTSGTIALFLSMKTANIGIGDEVIIPNITFVATANAVSLTGATPVLTDVYKDNLTIDLKKISEKITYKTKAIIPVHLSGRAANMDSLINLSKKHNLFLIEDATEALGSCYYGKPLGSFGFTGCFSFTSSKMITTGQGGAIVTNDKDAYHKIRALRDHGRFNRGTGADDPHNSIGYNFKYTDLQAAVGLAQLGTLSTRLQKQRELYNRYKTNLKNILQIKLLPFNIKEGEVPLWIDAICDKRDELINFLHTKQIDSRNFWLPLHTQKPYRQSDKNYPVSFEVQSKAFWLPSSLNLTNIQVDYVCEMIREFFTKN